MKTTLIEYRHNKTLGDKTYDQLKEKDIHWE